MRPFKLLPWLFCLALLLQAAGSFAAITTNLPGIIFLDHTAPYDQDVTNFIARAGISPRGAEAKAVAKLVFELKHANLWTNFYALYPLVGGNAAACAQNLVSTNYLIAWSGTNTFDRFGVTGDGVSGSGDTGFILSSLGVNTNNLHLYAFDVHNGVGSTGTFLGAGQANAWSAVGTVAASLATCANNTQQGDTSDSIPSGNVISSRKSTNETILVYWPGPWGYTNLNYWAAYVSNNIVPTGVITNSMKLMGNTDVGNQMGGYVNSTLGAASFGRYLDHAQVTNYFGIMNRFEQSLNRAHHF